MTSTFNEMLKKLETIQRDWAPTCFKKKTRNFFCLALSASCWLAHLAPRLYRYRVYQRYRGYQSWKTRLVIATLLRPSLPCTYLRCSCSLRVHVRVYFFQIGRGTLLTTCTERSINVAKNQRPFSRRLLTFIPLPYGHRVCLAYLPPSRETST